MAKEILLPKLGLTMNEGTILEWIKKEGDAVEVGDVLFVVESDKAALDVEAQESGILREIIVPELSTVPVGTVVGVLTAEGEVIPEEVTIQNVNAENKSEKVEEKVTSKEKEKEKSSPINADSPSSYILASPRARDLAQKYKFDLKEVSGTGPQGSIVEGDVLDFLKKKQDVLAGMDGEIALSRIKMAGAEKMTESWNTIPQFTLYATMNVDSLLEAYSYFKNTCTIPISLNVLFAKIIAHAIKKYPLMNSTWLGNGKVRLYKEVNIGIAMNTEEGLIVPVLKSCNEKEVEIISREWVDIVGRIRGKVYSVDDVNGATITLSNLGMFGVNKFRAIINPPQVAILGIGQTERKAIEAEGGEGIIFKTIITVSLTADHRIIDGAYGAKFLSELRKMIENPIAMIL